MTLTSRIRSKHPKPVCRQANKTTNKSDVLQTSDPSLGQDDRSQRLHVTKPAPTSQSPADFAALLRLQYDLQSLCECSDHKVKELLTVGTTKAPWRQLQSRCANCERLFFTSLSSLAGAAGRFCSLDCKANLEYMNQFQEVMDATWESSDSTCGWTDEDEYEDVERDQQM
ncbi:unnamed protein product [Peronospora effusa]|nr:unnamed protein product [Peronospora effusa]